MACLSVLIVKRVPGHICTGAQIYESSLGFGMAILNYPWKMTNPNLN